MAAPQISCPSAGLQSSGDISRNEVLIRNGVLVSYSMDTGSMNTAAGSSVVA